MVLPLLLLLVTLAGLALPLAVATISSSLPLVAPPLDFLALLLIAFILGSFFGVVIFSAPSAEGS
jgi:hypothetical protein